MKTKTGKEYASIFDDRVVATITDAKKRFDDLNEEFLAAAKKNPTFAIEHRGASVVRAEEAYRSIAHVRAYLEKVGDEYATKKEAVQACLDYFRDSLIRGATDSPSSCGVKNGVDLAKRFGIADAVRSLELLVDHEFIDA